MSPSNKRRTTFESPSQSLLSRRQLVRLARNGLIVAAVLAAFVELVGEPLLRWEYRYRGSSSHPHILSATYVGLGRGRVESGALRNAGDCPVVLFAKPERPLWRQAAGWLTTPTSPAP